MRVLPSPFQTVCEEIHKKEHTLDAVVSLEDAHSRDIVQLCQWNFLYNVQI